MLRKKYSFISSCIGSDLVPRSRFGGSRTKKQGKGEGKGEEETRSGKIRLRGPESAPRVNCACPKSAVTRWNIACNVARNDRIASWAGFAGVAGNVSCIVPKVEIVPTSATLHVSLQMAVTLIATFARSIACNRFIVWQRLKSDMLSYVQYRHRVRYRVAFCFKNRGSLNLKPKTQALICFEGCSAAGQHVLAVLPTGYGKNRTDLSSCCLLSNAVLPRHWIWIKTSLSMSALKKIYFKNLFSLIIGQIYG